MQSQQLDWLSWFPVTKLQRPTTQETIDRHWLVDRLHQIALAHRLTLIAAPAGSGKTTLAADLARRADAFGFVWLSLDEGDNNLQAFLLAVAVALLSECDSEFIQLINSGQLQARQVASLLINRLDQTESSPLVVVLDDLHLITDATIHEFLDYLLERLPARVHMVITTRYDPPLSLAKLRARGDLAELRLDTLRFRLEEAAEFLNRLLNLNLPDPLVAQLYQRTEGWVAGLRLLALSLENIDADKRVTYITELAQNDRYVFELLAEEVLAQQHDDIRRFLLETSILEELTSGLCEAVTRQADAGDKLRELHRHNLFLVSVGDGSYRYHALFRDVLQAQLKRQQPDQFKELHRRAAAAQPLPLKALQHHIAADAWADGIQIVRDLILQSANNFAGTRLEAFVRAMPSDLQEREPWLLLFQGAIAGQRGHYSVARPRLEKAERLFRATRDRQGELLAFSELIRIDVQSDPTLMQRIDNAIDSFKDVMTTQQHIWFLTGRMWSGVFLNQPHQVEAAVIECIDTLIKYDELSLYKTISQSIGSYLFFTSQGMRPFQRLLPFMERFTSHDLIVRMGYTNIQAFVHLLSGRPEAALDMAQASTRIVDQLGGLAWANNHLLQIILTVLHIQENDAEFDRYYHERLPPMMQLDADRIQVPLYMYVYGRRLLRQKRVDEARDVGDQIEASLYIPAYHSLLLALRAHIACCDRDFSRAETLMQQAVRAQRENVATGVPLYAPMGLPQVYWQMGERALALDSLRAALGQVTRWDMPLLVLQEGRDMVPLLQAAIDAGIEPSFCAACMETLTPAHTARPIPVPGSSETLTPREVDILRELVAGASNREIADTFVISENTVKSHITRILGKLDAKSRTEAAARVRTLRIPL